MKPVAQQAPGSEVMVATLALAIGAVGAAEVRAFGPHDAYPAEVFEHGAGEIWARALWVEVFVAKNERSVVCERALVSRPESARVTEVQQSGG